MMQALAPEYQQRIEEIKAAIQESELLDAYLESEEAAEYNALKEAFEPEIAALHEEAAAFYPLQLEALELGLLDPGLEGLFMPKLLGYAVLRPRVNPDSGQYYRPQAHLKKVLLAIAGSNGFTELERRIGQGITVALALSTNVWVSTVLNEIPNKHPRNFFQQHHDQSLHTAAQRLQVYERYKRQFAYDNYAAAAFPVTTEELATDYPALEEFLRTRFSRELDNASLVDPILDFLENPEFRQERVFEHFIALTCLFMDVPDEQENALRTQIRDLSAEPEFVQRYFDFLAELHHDDRIDITPEVDRRMALRVGVTGDGLMQQYYALATTIHDSGVNALEAQDAIRLFVREQEGLSNVNECVRQTVLRYLRQLISNLDEDTYSEFFELTKLFSTHFEIFGNESFKQEVRRLSLQYVKSLLKRYTDKRGRDYQDIKKFVKTSFVDLGFMGEKEVANLFKTKRVRRPTAA